MAMATTVKLFTKNIVCRYEQQKKMWWLYSHFNGLWCVFVISSHVQPDYSRRIGMRIEYSLWLTERFAHGVIVCAFIYACDFVCVVREFICICKSMLSIFSWIADWGHVYKYILSKEIENANSHIRTSHHYILLHNMCGSRVYKAHSKPILFKSNNIKFNSK